MKKATDIKYHRWVLEEYLFENKEDRDKWLDAFHPDRQPAVIPNVYSLPDGKYLVIRKLLVQYYEGNWRTTASL